MKIKNLKFGLALLIFGVGIYADNISAQPTPPPPMMQPAPPGGLNPGTPPPPPSSDPLPPPSATPPGWGAPGYLSNAPFGSLNQGTLNVMATGYDNESVLVQIPLVVSFSFNGANYDVTVLNAWSPFTQSWNTGLDQPASPTYYYFNGFYYNYTVSLPSGTYYFNL